MSQFRPELCVAVGQQHNFQPAFLAFGQRRSVDLDCLAIGGRVQHFDSAASPHLDAVVLVGSAVEDVFPKACLRIVNLE